MRLNITAKIIILTLFLSFLPLLASSLATFYYLTNSEKELANIIVNMHENIDNNNLEILNELGEDSIIEKSRMVAKQLDLYLQFNPDKTLADLLADPEFQALSVQRVGETGYTATFDYDKQIMLTHKFPEKVGLNFYDLKETLPRVYQLQMDSREGKEVSGYYEWEDIDGQIYDKFISITPLKNKTAEGVGISLSATTYIREFNQTAEAVSSKHDIESEYMLEEIKLSKNKIVNFSYQIFLLIILFNIILSLIFSWRLVNPIRKLIKAGNRISSGDFQTEIPIMKAGDEIATLRNSLEAMRKELNSFKYNMEQKVSDRTKELEKTNNLLTKQKNEMEKFMKIAVDREQKMIELKKEIKNLKIKHNN